MPDREKVIKGLHDARRFLEDKEWSDRRASPHIDSINDALALLKEQEEFRRIMFNRCCALTGEESCDICRFQKECFRERSLTPV